MTETEHGFLDLVGAPEPEADDGSARMEIEVPAAAYPEPKPSEPKSFAVMCGMPCSVRVMVALYFGAAAAAPPETEGTTTESSAGTRPSVRAAAMRGRFEDMCSQRATR